jgi:hypothetical protein
MEKCPCNVRIRHFHFFVSWTFLQLFTPWCRPCCCFLGLYLYYKISRLLLVYVVMFLSKTYFVYFYFVFVIDLSYNLIISAKKASCIIRFTNYLSYTVRTKHYYPVRTSNLSLCHFFPDQTWHLILLYFCKWHDFCEKSLSHEKYVLIFSTTFIKTLFLPLRYYSEPAKTFKWSVWYLPHFLTKLEHSLQILTKLDIIKF